jgi:hypothetical protein
LPEWRREKERVREWQRKGMGGGTTFCVKRWWTQKENPRSMMTMKKAVKTEFVTSQRAAFESDTEGRKWEQGGQEGQKTFGKLKIFAIERWSQLSRQIDLRATETQREHERETDRERQRQREREIAGSACSKKGETW